jgi:hypothetical protein
MKIATNASWKRAKARLIFRLLPTLNRLTKKLLYLSIHSQIRLNRLRTSLGLRWIQPEESYFENSSEDRYYRGLEDR